MIQSADADAYVEVWVKGQLGLTAEGKEDYYNKFRDFMNSFIDREITPIHVIAPNSDFTLHIDGKVL